MAEKVSRRKIADYIAERIAAGEPVAPLLDEVAAYMIEMRNTRDTDLMVRAIEDALAARGIVVASVSTAHELEDPERKAVKELIGAKQTYLREHIDPELLGGVLIQTPSATLDATLRRKLMMLSAAKV